MAQSLVVSGLVAKRSETAGEVEHYRRELQRLGEELGHLDATIRLFDPTYDRGAVRSRKRGQLQEDAENGLSLRLRRLLDGLWGDLVALDHRIVELEAEIGDIANSDPLVKRLQQLRGVGPLTGMKDRIYIGCRTEALCDQRACKRGGAQYRLSDCESLRTITARTGLSMQTKNPAEAGWC